MQEIILNTIARPIPTPALKTVKKDGRVIAEVYGHGQKNQHLLISQSDFDKAYKQAGESSLISLKVDSAEVINVLINEVQRDPLTSKINHVDFLQVNMKEELHASIPLIFVGESKAVKELGGTLVKSLEEVEVVCLPADLVHEIEVDISSLNTFDDAIRVADLRFSDKIKVETNPETTVATVLPQKVETVETAAPEAVMPEPVVAGAKAESESAE